MTQFKPTHRHKKRGSVYQFLGQALIQTDTPIVDNDIVNIYCNDAGGQYARKPSEFNDGRFEELTDDSQANLQEGFTLLPYQKAIMDWAMERKVLLLPSEADDLMRIIERSLKQ